MSFIQKLVNAQISVNRSVFEVNKPGSTPKEKYRISYLMKEINCAIRDLNLAFNELNQVHSVDCKCSRCENSIE